MRASYLPLARAQHLKRKYLLLARVPRHRFAVDDGARDVIAKRVAHARDDVRVFGRVVLLVATVYVNGTVFVEVNLEATTKRTSCIVSELCVCGEVWERWSHLCAFTVVLELAGEGRIGEALEDLLNVTRWMSQHGFEWDA